MENKALRDNISVLESKLKELENRLEEATKVSAFFTWPGFCLCGHSLQKGSNFERKIENTLAITTKGKIDGSRANALDGLLLYD